MSLQVLKHWDESKCGQELIFQKKYHMRPGSFEILVKICNLIVGYYKFMDTSQCFDSLLVVSCLLLWCTRRLRDVWTHTVVLWKQFGISFISWAHIIRCLRTWNGRCVKYCSVSISFFEMLPIHYIFIISQMKTFLEITTGIGDV